MAQSGSLKTRVMTTTSTRQQLKPQEQHQVSPSSETTSSMKAGSPNTPKIDALRRPQSDAPSFYDRAMKPLSRNRLAAVPKAPCRPIRTAPLNAPRRLLAKHPNHTEKDTHADKVPHPTHIERATHSPPLDRIPHPLLYTHADKCTHPHTQPSMTNEHDNKLVDTKKTTTSRFADMTRSTLINNRDRFRHHPTVSTISERSEPTTETDVCIHKLVTERACQTETETAHKPQLINRPHLLSKPQLLKTGPPSTNSKPSAPVRTAKAKPAPKSKAQPAVKAPGLRTQPQRTQRVIAQQKKDLTAQNKNVTPIKETPPRKLTDRSTLQCNVPRRNLTQRGSGANKDVSNTHAEDKKPDRTPILRAGHVVALEKTKLKDLIVPRAATCEERVPGHEARQSMSAVELRFLPGGASTARGLEHLRSCSDLDTHRNNRISGVVGPTFQQAFRRRFVNRDSSFCTASDSPPRTNITPAADVSAWRGRGLVPVSHRQRKRSLLESPSGPSSDESFRSSHSHSSPDLLPARSCPYTPCPATVREVPPETVARLSRTRVCAGRWNTPCRQQMFSTPNVLLARTPVTDRASIRLSFGARAPMRRPCSRSLLVSGILNGNAGLVESVMSRLEDEPDSLVYLPSRVRSLFAANGESEELCHATLLFLAVKSGSYAVVSLLLRLGANVHKVDREKRTALHLLFLPDPVTTAAQQKQLSATLPPKERQSRRCRLSELAIDEDSVVIDHASPSPLRIAETPLSLVSPATQDRVSLVTPRVATDVPLERGLCARACCTNRASSQPDDMARIVSVLCEHGVNLEAADAAGNVASTYARAWLEQGCKEIANTSLTLEERIAASSMKAAALTLLGFEDHVRLRLLVPMATAFKLTTIAPPRVERTAPSPCTARGKSYRRGNAKRPSAAARVSVNRRSEVVADECNSSDKVMRHWTGAARREATPGQMFAQQTNTSDFDLAQMVKFSTEHQKHPGLLRIWEFLGGTFQYYPTTERH